MPKSKKKNPKDFKYTPTQARENFYSIVKDAGATYHTHEIIQRGSNPVVLVNTEKYKRILQFVPPEELKKIDEEFKTNRSEKEQTKYKYPDTAAVFEKWAKRIEKKFKNKPIPESYRTYIFDRDAMYDEVLEEKGLK